MAAIIVDKTTFQFPGMIKIKTMERKPEINATEKNLMSFSCMHNKARNIPGRANQTQKHLYQG